MINFIFRLFLTFNATSLILVVFLVKEKKVINNISPYLSNFPHWVSYILYFILPVLLTLLSLIVSKFLADDNIEAEEGKSVIKEVEQANNAYLPSYLGYFFVALSVPQYETLIFVFAILFLFTFLSQTLYFNPLFLVFGYHFYYLTTETNIKIFLITKKNLKDPSKLNFPKLKRVNDFTFIDKENN
ncbi:hypothetical protein A3860_26000 [Niastella vici]|uniref:Uncharacterized protein n=1 Tax=Niastella vici TaxID=1703345 RepID=A0A1V9FX36_9BACT|nr:hypothetical protein [Niastella vici]OQP62912.1 hypothetical protein A3860_26000 [Niastella vici]